MSGWAPGVALLDTLVSWIPARSEVAIIDVPVHRNAGDLFILAVATQLLTELECRTVYRAGVRDYRVESARRQIGRDTILIGLGGGNFGDDYPRYQALREQVVADFPQNRIVILPQTVHFRDPQAWERTVRLLSRHSDLRIAVRDPASLALVNHLTADARLFPDMVHALGPQLEDAPPGGDRTAVLMRRDQESNVETPHGSVDWSDLFPELIGRVAVAAAAMPFAPAPISLRLHDSWSDYSTSVFARGLGWMRTIDHLVTDRLHAAILARLSGRRVTLHDHGYGKLAAYYRTWWRDDGAVTLHVPGFD